MAALDATSRLVVVGAGHAGVQLAVALRELGYHGDLLLLHGERTAPYDRPTLSKDFLTDVDHPPLFLRSDAFFAEPGIRLERARAERIDREGRSVVAADGRSWSCDHVVLATGGRPHRLSLPGAGLDGVVELRTIDDARDLRDRLAVSQRLVVIGGGFIGLEIAAAARALDVEVVVVEAQERLMARATSELLSTGALNYHQEAGTRFVLGRQVVALEGRGVVAAVILDDASRLAADLVVVGVGMAANDQLAQEAGLQTDRGVLVDDMLRSSDPWISAIGDCAVVTRGDGTRHRLESIANAHAQARVLAERLLGLPASPTPAPWFWSHQGGLKLQMVGEPGAVDHSLQVGDAAKFSVLGFRNDSLTVVESFNDAGVHLAARRLFDRGEPVTLERCREHEFDLRQLARKPVQTAGAPS